MRKNVFKKKPQYAFQSYWRSETIGQLRRHFVQRLYRRDTTTQDYNEQQCVLELRLSHTHTPRPEKKKKDIREAVVD